MKHKKIKILILLITIPIAAIWLLTIIFFVLSVIFDSYIEIKETEKADLIFKKEQMLRTKITTDKNSNRINNFVYSTINDKSNEKAILENLISKNNDCMARVYRVINFKNSKFYIVQNWFEHAPLYFTEIYEYNFKTKKLTNLGWYEGRYDYSTYNIQKENELLMCGGRKIEDWLDEKGPEFNTCMIIYIKERN